MTKNLNILLVHGAWRDPEGFNFPQSKMFSDAALRQFGLSYGPKIKRRWFLWE
jgi:ABC-type uncharacterized transport system permease subunit